MSDLCPCCLRRSVYTYPDGFTRDMCRACSDERHDLPDGIWPEHEETT